MPDVRAGSSSSRHTVAALAYDDMSAFEIGIVTEVFGVSWPGVAIPSWYDLTICAERPDPVPMVGGATLQSPHGLDVLASADTVIIPSVSDVTVEASPGLVAALRRAHERGARLVSICTGAFALAAAGLLDGRRVTTHWQHADELRQRFPHLEVDSSPLYLDHGDVLTSAGSAAGLDLCIHLVRKDFGAELANALARRLVIAPHREGGQAQYIESPVTADSGDEQIADTMAWALAHLATPITVDVLARRAHMSTRTYLRRFGRYTGTSPARWLISRRVQASLPLLETTAATIEQIAIDVGFEKAVTYRHHFTRAMRTSPSAYRRAFRAT